MRQVNQSHIDSVLRESALTHLTEAQLKFADVIGQALASQWIDEQTKMSTTPKEDRNTCKVETPPIGIDQQVKTEPRR